MCQQVKMMSRPTASPSRSRWLARRDSRRRACASRAASTHRGRAESRPECAEQPGASPGRARTCATPASMQRHDTHVDVPRGACVTGGARSTSASATESRAACAYIPLGKTHDVRTSLPSEVPRRRPGRRLGSTWCSTSLTADQQVPLRLLRLVVSCSRPRVCSPSPSPEPDTGDAWCAVLSQAPSSLVFFTWSVSASSPPCATKDSLSAVRLCSLLAANALGSCLASQLAASSSAMSRAARAAEKSAAPLSLTSHPSSDCCRSAARPSACATHLFTPRPNAARRATTGAFRGDRLAPAATEVVTLTCVCKSTSCRSRSSARTAASTYTSRPSNRRARDRPTACASRRVAWPNHRRRAWRHGPRANLNKLRE